MILHHRAIIERHQNLAGPKIGDLPPRDAPGVPPLRDQMMEVVVAGPRARVAQSDGVAGPPAGQPGEDAEWLINEQLAQDEEAETTDGQPPDA